jgi:uncharacterized protein
MRILFVLLFLCGCAATPKNQPPNGTDVHVHIHNNQVDDLVFDAERFVLAMEAARLKRAVVLSQSYARTSNQKCWGKKNCAYDSKWVREKNQWTIDQAKKFPEQLIPFCGIEIAPEANLADEIKFCSEAGAKGLKIHMQAARKSLMDAKVKSKFIEVVQQAGKLNLIILIHAGTQVPQEAEVLFEIAKANSDTKFILAHMLNRNYEMLATHSAPNVYTDVSAILARVRGKETEIVELLRKFGIDRVLFGSDWPVYHPTEMLAVIKSYPFTKEELEKIISKNAEELGL